MQFLGTKLELIVNFNTKGGFGSKGIFTQIQNYRVFKPQKHKPSIWKYENSKWISNLHISMLS